MFQNAGEAAAVALTRQAGELVSVCEALDGYARQVEEQHRVLRQQIADLAECTLTESVESVDRMCEAVPKLEETFRRIDHLQATLDDIQAKVFIVNRAVKAIEKPADIKERAASLLKSFGWKSKKVDETATANLWNRIPQHAMLDGSSAQEFEERIRGVFASFHSQR